MDAMEVVNAEVKVVMKDTTVNIRNLQNFRWMRVRVTRMVDGPFGAGGNEGHDDAKSEETVNE